MIFLLCSITRGAAEALKNIQPPAYHTRPLMQESSSGGSLTHETVSGSRLNQGDSFSPSASLDTAADGLDCGWWYIMKKSELVGRIDVSSSAGTDGDGIVPPPAQTTTADSASSAVGGVAKLGSRSLPREENSEDLKYLMENLEALTHVLVNPRVP